MKNKFKIFYDPIHGRIEMPMYCMDIINTTEFQRLRNLKQLGVSNYIFHGAVHTRFEHSIGVSWLCGKWIKHLARQQPELDITEKDIKIVQIAGLTHDIGHGPFSHLFERFLHISNDLNIKNNPHVKKSQYRHEDMSVKIVRRLNLDPDVSDIVCKIIQGTPLKEKPFIGHIVNNHINGLDADKLDYFTRDSLYTLFKIGCDWRRIIYESKVINNEIVFPYKCVGDIFDVYQTRYRLYKEIYLHNTTTKVENMILQALLIAESKKLFKFLDSSGNYVSLSESVNDITSFLETQDDIIGQMERFRNTDITNILTRIKKRNFEKVEIDNNKIAHYGLYNENPLLKVKFFDKNNDIVIVDQQVIDTICPIKFISKM
jgi:HD superfamily phosphohydrolase